MTNVPVWAYRLLAALRVGARARVRLARTAARSRLGMGNWGISRIIAYIIAIKTTEDEDSKLL